MSVWRGGGCVESHAAWATYTPHTYTHAPPPIQCPAGANNGVLSTGVQAGAKRWQDTHSDGGQTRRGLFLCPLRCDSHHHINCDGPHSKARSEARKGKGGRRLHYAYVTGIFPSLLPPPPPPPPHKSGLLDSFCPASPASIASPSTRESHPCQYGGDGRRHATEAPTLPGPQGG